VTIRALMDSIRDVDLAQGGCTVTFFYTNIPPNNNPPTTGYIDCGISAYRYHFASEYEMAGKLKELAHR